jgi:hypothetical protein
MVVQSDTEIINSRDAEQDIAPEGKLAFRRHSRESRDLSDGSRHKQK